MALIHRDVVDPHRGDVVNAGGHDPLPVRRSSVAIPREREMRMEWTRFQRDAVLADAVGHRALQRGRGLGARSHAQPQNVRRTPRRKHAESAKAEIEHIVRQVGTGILDERWGAPFVDLAQKGQRQVHAIGTHPLHRRAALVANRGGKPFLLPADRRTRGIVKIDGDEQPHVPLTSPQLPSASDEACSSPPASPETSPSPGRR